MSLSSSNHGLLFSLCVLCASAVNSHAVDPAKKLTYDEHVLPILRDKCLSCHNQDKKSGGLVLNTYTSLMEGGGAGSAIEPGNPDESYLLKLVEHRMQPSMPPKSPKLPAEQLATLRQWIAAGALENAGSKAKIANKPKYDIALKSVNKGKPDVPPMPGKLGLEPVVVTPRATAITALAASPWAPLVAVGGQKQILLYHSDTLDLLGVLAFPEGVPHVLKFSRNGGLLLAGGGVGAKQGKVAVYNVTTGERVFTVGDEFDTVLAADISADQSFIALGGPSKMIRIYSTKDGQLVHDIKKHTDWIYSLEFSPDGVLLATADRNGGVHVWETNSGREYLTLRGHTAAVTDLSWRIDGNVLATCSEDTTIRLWEMENGGQIRSWGGHGGGCQSVRFTKDGRLVSTGRDRVTKLWDQNGAQQRPFEAFPDVGLRVAVTHDSARVIASDWTGQLKVWNTADGKALGQLVANPPTVAQQLENAKKDLAAAQVKHDQLAAAAAASKAAADKANAELAAATKAVTDTANAAKAAADAVPPAKARVDLLTSQHTAAQMTVPPRQQAAALLAEAAVKAKAAAEQLKENKELAAFAASAEATSQKAAADLAAVQKLVADLAASLKTASDQHAAAVKNAQATQAAAAAAPAQAEARKMPAKAASDKAAADAAAVPLAAAELARAKAAVEKWTAAIAAAAPKAAAK
jgi:WD40 repeat protein